MNREKALDMAKEFALFIVVTAVAFAWWMLMLLILSFICLSVIRFTMEGIYIISIVGTIATDIFYIIRRVRKYRKTMKREMEDSVK